MNAPDAPLGGTCKIGIDADFDGDGHVDLDDVARLRRAIGE